CLQRSNWPHGTF
nr:immunoglobulin light chain junction region [Macaca mulatta]